MNTEYNRIIAEFMGMTQAKPNESRWENDWFEKLTVDGNKFESGSRHTHLYFDSDWNWLMEVIKEIGNKTGFTLVMEENTSYWCNNGEYITDEPEFGGYGDISNIYEAVVDFLKWYNSQQNG